ncbi:arylesterase [Balneatrix alpica]|uniref:Arylesterase n=1 Tax=Balneatrix alpica TaxID=75684 RepID=A0ABV5ZEZ6_9GAMM|nr:arylesterase [Balneatrix alpica]
MRNPFFRFLLLGWLSLCGWAQASTLMIVGDSLSAAYGLRAEQGWVKLLEPQLPPDWRLINASMSGETSGGGLARLPALLEQHQPQWVLLELGGNDGLRGLPLASLQQNLTLMVELAQAQGARVAILGVRIPPNYGPQYADAFAQLFTTLGQTLAVPVLPFFIEPVALNPELMQSDGIHPNAQAQPILAKHVGNWLLPLLNADKDNSLVTK